MRSLPLGLLLSTMIAAGASAAPLEGWLAVEGGAAFFDANFVQAYGVQSGPGLVDRPLNIGKGVYGRFEVARLPNAGSRAFGIFDGVGFVVQGHWGKASISEAATGGSLLGAGDGAICGGCSPLTSTMTRSYLEVSPQLLKRLSAATLLGIEPFAGRVAESVDSTMQGYHRTSEIDATALGLFVSLQHVLALGGHWSIHARAAGGAYWMDVGIDTTMDGVTGTPPARMRSYSDSLAGFRGQVALGLDYAVSPTFAVGVVGRLDYWSGYPTFRSSDFGTAGTNNAPESAFHDNFFSGYLGIRLVAKMGS